LNWVSGKGVSQSNMNLTSHHAWQDWHQREKPDPDESDAEFRKTCTTDEGFD
jgi:hypothetical protein